MPVLEKLTVGPIGDLNYPTTVESSVEYRFAPFTVVEDANGINLINQFPTPDEKGKLFEGVNYVYNFTLILGSKTKGAYYELTAIENQDNNLDPSYVKIYLEKNGQAVPFTIRENGRVKTFNEFSGSTHEGAEGKVILSDYVTEEDVNTGKIEFKLRMWVSEDVKVNETNYENFNNKKFGVRVNTYAQFEGWFMKNENKEEKSIFSQVKWWFHFITTIIMNSIIIILVLIGILFAIYYFDVMKNTRTGNWQPPLFQAYVIISQSMEPSIHVQDAIVTKRVDDYQIGDVCTYLSKNPSYMGIMITHRIIGIDTNESGEKVYIFKGDANYSADQLPVEKDQIYGKVVMKIPKIGYVQYFLSNAYGWIVAIVVPCVGIITFDVIKLINSSRKSRRKRRGGEWKIKHYLFVLLYCF